MFPHPPTPPFLPSREPFQKLNRTVVLYQDKKIETMYRDLSDESNRNGMATLSPGLAASLVLVHDTAQIIFVDLLIPYKVV